MDTNINEVIFEKDPAFRVSFEGNPYNLMLEFLSSGYYHDDTLEMNRFLLPDKTIDLEKLELALSMIIEYQEFSDNSENPIYVFLGNMDKYFQARGIDPTNIERITEEASFILGFCKAIVDEESLIREVVVQYVPTKEEFHS